MNKSNVLFAVPAALLLAGSLLLAPSLSGAADTSPTGPQEAAKEGGPVEGLKPVSAFDSIADEKQRSIAIFEETGKVLQHPRCVNCHPAGDRPLQTMAMTLHQPPVFRGPADFGLTGMTCNTCHGPANAEVVAQAEGLQSIPGDPNWHLAPIEMAWQGKTLGEICVQIKDVNRNGGKTLEEIVHHMGQDHLVGWGWNPGKGREKVPGTQEEFGKLYEAWAATGAHCPGE
ncbi:Isoquinoline 1-oxidoreductase subunit [Mangrovicella endophytica]|uniref:Isoquinoline 1-oxidoreductase subunit n=1 Tax=Mangrovicella endophytica TaxID=2066697 RepID=UPI001FE087B5|nr:Isoquinoline 1-oxidoreductase subunit [Mangrovicella endophytica]